MKERMASLIDSILYFVILCMVDSVADDVFVEFNVLSLFGKTNAVKQRQDYNACSSHSFTSSHIRLMLQYLLILHRNFNILNRRF